MLSSSLSLSFSFHFHCDFLSPQDQTKRTKPSTLRRTLNALRQRLTRRSRTKPPDWFLEKFSNTNNVDKIGKTTIVTTTAAVAASEEGAGGPTAAHTAPADEGLSSEIRGSSRLCNRLSVNPTLQSHYRVSSNIISGLKLPLVDFL